MSAQLATVNTISRSASDESPVVLLQFDCGYLSPYFVTNPGLMEVVYEDVYVLIYEMKISSKMDLLPLLELFTTSGKALLIIAEDVGGDALAALVVNKLRGSLKVAAVKAPGLRDPRNRMLQHIALLTGGKAITEDLDAQLKNVQMSDLGRARKITIGKNSTVIEGRTKCGRVFSERRIGSDSNIHDFTAHSSQAHIPTGIYGILST